MSAFDYLNLGAVGGDYGENVASGIVSIFTSPLAGLSAFGRGPAGEAPPSSRLLSEPQGGDALGGEDFGGPNPEAYATSTNPPSGYVRNPQGVMGSFLNNGTFEPAPQQGDKPISMATKMPYLPSVLPKGQQYAAIKAQGDIDASKAYWDSLGNSLSTNLNIASGTAKVILLVGGVIAAAIIFSKLKG